MSVNKTYGYLVTTDNEGSSVTKRIKLYATYEDMVADEKPGVFAIVTENNAVYHKTEHGWVVGFPQVTHDDYYSAFEVFAHNQDYAKGDYIPELCKEGDTAAVAIPACMGHHLIVCSEQTKDVIDVIVDWGDGSVERAADVPDAEIVNGRYHMYHMYEKPGKYIVKIFGKDYWCFRPQAAQSNELAKEGYDNLICRIMARDLPVAPHLYNYSGLCHTSPRLFYVDVFDCNFKFFASHVDNLFYLCKNLVSVTGFVKSSNNWTRASNVFFGCSALRTTDFKLPARMVGDGPNTWFSNCLNLAIDITTIFPDNFTPSETPRAGSMFYNCKLLTGDVSKVAKYLWDSDFNWTVTGSAFTGCSDAIRAQVPVSWGGTKAE